MAQTGADRRTAMGYNVATNIFDDQTEADRKAANSWDNHAELEDHKHLLKKHCGVGFVDDVVPQLMIDPQDNEDEEGVLHPPVDKLSARPSDRRKMRRQTETAKAARSARAAEIDAENDRMLEELEGVRLIAQEAMKEVSKEEEKMMTEDEDKTSRTKSRNQRSRRQSKYGKCYTPFQRFCRNIVLPFDSSGGAVVEVIWTWRRPC